MQRQARARIGRKKNRRLQTGWNFVKLRLYQVSKHVLFIDQCHLLWGDICGYVWGKTDQRIEVPVVNERQKQTYYGALNLHTQKFLIQAYDQGNSQSTIAFLQYLRTHNVPNAVLL